MKNEDEVEEKNEDGDEDENEDGNEEEAKDKDNVQNDFTGYCRSSRLM